jgi:cobalt-zinc-cadmium efflux system membrane fusion protein
VLGAVDQAISVPGEVKVNADRVAHVVPRAPGIVREVTKTLGDDVKAGETLAWVESGALAEAKLDFFAKESEVGCCEIELPRAKAIYENVAKLSGQLLKEVSEAELQKMDALEMGKYRGQLLTAYAAYLEARTTHGREVGLHAKNISSARELMAAETALKQARAQFNAAMDTARYETLIAYTEAAQARQVAVFEAVAAEKRLRLKGADDAVIKALRALVPKVAATAPCLCDDPNCKEGILPAVADILGKDDHFAWSPLLAPFGGTLIEKHIVLGESVDTESEVFTVADLSSVWVDLALSQDVIPSVQAGYAAVITLPNGVETEAIIDFISPIIAEATRTALARVVVDNKAGTFRPGTFVEASIRIPTAQDAVLVPKDSVQLVNDHTCVFVWGNSDFELREVKTGASDGKQIEILSGLSAGDAVASENAFHLKAEYIKTAAGDLGAHHGHNH